MEAIVAQGHKRATVIVTVLSSIPTQGNKLFKIYISSGKAKRAVKFHQSIRNTCRIREKVENEKVLMEMEHLNIKFLGKIEQI